MKISYEEMVTFAKSYDARILSGAEDWENEIDRLRLEMTRQTLEYYKASPRLFYADPDGVLAARKKQMDAYFQGLHGLYTGDGREFSYEDEYFELWFCLAVQDNAHRYAPPESGQDGAETAKFSRDSRDFYARLAALKKRHEEDV